MGSENIAGGERGPWHGIGEERVDAEGRRAVRLVLVVEGPDGEVEDPVEVGIEPQLGGIILRRVGDRQKLLETGYRVAAILVRLAEELDVLVSGETAQHDVTKLPAGICDEEMRAIGEIGEALRDAEPVLRRDRRTRARRR